MNKYDDPIFDLSISGFLKKYKKQIKESNIDDNVKNYILSTLKEYNNNLYENEFYALENFLTSFLQFKIYYKYFGMSFGYYVISKYDYFYNGLKYNGFKKRLKSSLDYFKEKAKQNMRNIYCYSYIDNNKMKNAAYSFNYLDDFENLMEYELSNITYELLSDTSLKSRSKIMEILNNDIDEKYSHIIY